MQILGGWRARSQTCQAPTFAAWSDAASPALTPEITFKAEDRLRQTGMSKSVTPSRFPVRERTTNPGPKVAPEPPAAYLDRLLRELVGPEWTRTLEPPPVFKEALSTNRATGLRPGWDFPFTGASPPAAINRGFQSQAIMTEPSIRLPSTSSLAHI